MTIPFIMTTEFFLACVGASILGYGLINKRQEIKIWGSQAWEGAVGKIFGDRANVSSIEDSIENGRVTETQLISQKYHLEDKALELYRNKGKFLDGARFAKKIQNKPAADEFYRMAAQYVRHTQPVKAAEILEEGGFLTDALDIWKGLDNQVAKEKTMKLADKLGRTELAERLRKELRAGNYNPTGFLGRDREN